MCNISDHPLCEPSSVSILRGNSAQQIFIECLLSLPHCAGQWGHKDNIGGGYGLINNEFLMGHMLGTVLSAVRTHIILTGSSLTDGTLEVQRAGCPPSFQPAHRKLGFTSRQLGSRVHALNHSPGQHH